MLVLAQFTIDINLLKINVIHNVFAHVFTSDCNTFYWFWFEWGGPAFEVGTGQVVGVDRFLGAAWTDFSRSFTIRSVGVAATSDAEPQSVIELRQPEGRCSHLPLVPTT